MIFNRATEPLRSAWTIVGASPQRELRTHRGGLSIANGSIRFQSILPNIQSLRGTLRRHAWRQLVNISQLAHSKNDNRPTMPRKEENRYAPLRPCRP